MYAKGKGSGVPSDGQAREKLALYVYEYLLHVGAQKSAQTFLSEVRGGQRPQTPQSHPGGVLEPLNPCWGC
uniref:LisH domain-containing protein n=1 Tax=Junco hyemalis TaxID=40217 RepID=A0A8C5IQS3_JUNHY